MNKTLFLFLFLFLGKIMFAQSTSNDKVIHGQLLVQFDTKKNAQQFSENSRALLIRKMDMISKRFHIYLLYVDAKSGNSLQEKKRIAQQKGVVNLQDNHRIALRESKVTFPNDSLFGNQWSLYNDGSNGGTAGADIDATDAWDITTGGFTATGDTLVVAIIDGGADIHHEDVDFWKNHAEIPNNGIDDDNNGYVDDYDGWNAYNHNGTIPLYNHGMHVAGIAGAIGNNNIGVSGVNWTVKILPIAGSSTSESVVVEALSYLYVVRERYDSTNGQQGAFVVADNCSFGVDKGNPANYPIWEAMYDSLGQLGVLSCAATANRPWDIDSVGDVPTAFSTDYMISVTNTTKRDHLYASAGWGDTTIDLGAPGTSILSTLINNSYGYKSGTSMATPHVTGSVALVLSAADSAFMVHFKKSPGEGALLIKNFILKGVDTLPDLLGKTVSGGRLNVFHAITRLINAPVIVTDKDSLYAEAPINTPIEEQLLLNNGGNDTLFYKLTINNQPQWITMSQDSGTLAALQQQDITFSFDDAGMDTGYYYCTLHITGEDAFSKTIPITFFVYNGVGFRDISAITSHVYPNPFSSHLNIIVENGINEPMLLTLFDAYGKTVYWQKTEAFYGSKVMHIPTESLAKGLYFYKLSRNHVVYNTGKVIKIAN